MFCHENASGSDSPCTYTVSLGFMVKMEKITLFVLLYYHEIQGERDSYSSCLPWLLGFYGINSKITMFVLLYYHKSNEKVTATAAAYLGSLGFLVLIVK